MKLAAITLFALIVCACTAQVPTTMCGSTPFALVAGPTEFAGVIWNGTVPSTKFTLTCYQSWFNNTGLIRTSTYVYCGAPSFTQGAHILLGQLPSSYFHGSMTFTCPVPGTFSVVTYNEGSTSATFTFQGSARTYNGEETVGKIISSRP